MQDPTLKGVQDPQETKTDAVSTGAADAAVDSSADIQPQAEVEAEEIMTAGEEQAAAAQDEAMAVAEEAPATAESLLEAAKALMEKDASELAGDEIRRLRQQFSMLHKVTDKAGDEAAGDAAEAKDDAEVVQDELQIQFDAIIEALRTRKAAWMAEQEAKRAANLERKNAIIQEILALADDTDNVNRTFARYRELQDEFNAVGDVEPAEETSVWKRYQEAREKYSDNLKINKELRDYDFKKNLAEKESLLAIARTEAMNEDVIAAYRHLQDLHNRWRQIGPVAKEIREEIWAAFRDASAEINKRYQAYFEARKAREAENETAKTALCEQLDAIDLSTLKTFAAWEEATATIQKLQEEWRQLGFASKKMNRALFGRFRGGCDAFFAAKADFYRSTREELAANLAHKQQLVEKAEALRESTEWRKTAQLLADMQKEWKTIGAIPKKYSDDLWKRFTAACDAFFEAKKKAGSGARQTENSNLHAKREVIGLLSALAEGDTAKDDAIAELHKLQDRWKEIGHVPFREKDKLYEAYRSAVDAVRTRFAMAQSRARRERFEASVAELADDNSKLHRERERLARILEGRRADLRTYENNLGFLSAKSGSGLMRDLERRIDALKTDIADLEEKIAILDNKMA